MKIHIDIDIQTRSIIYHRFWIIPLIDIDFIPDHQIVIEIRETTYYQKHRFLFVIIFVDSSPTTIHANIQSTLINILISRHMHCRVIIIIYAEWWWYTIDVIKTSIVNILLFAHSAHIDDSMFVRYASARRSAYSVPHGPLTNNHRKNCAWWYLHVYSET